MKQSVAILTNFVHADPAYSLNRTVQDQITMLVAHGYRPRVLVQQAPTWSEPPEAYGLESVELIQLPAVYVPSQIEKDPDFDSDIEKLHSKLRTALEGIDIVLTHDIIYQPAGLKLNIAGRQVARELPAIRWFHWIHSATSPYQLHRDGILSDLHIGLLDQKWPNSNAVFFLSLIHI